VAHTADPKERLLHRVRRIRGQVEAIERLLVEGEELSSILGLIAASRGAINGLMAEIIEQHVHQDILAAKSDRERNKAVDDLLEVIGSYLR